MSFKAVSFRADPALLDRVAAECERRGCTKTEAFAAGLLLWLQDPPRSRRQRLELARRKVPAERAGRAWL